MEPRLPRPCPAHLAGTSSAPASSRQRHVHKFAGCNAADEPEHKIRKTCSVNEQENIQTNRLKVVPPPLSLTNMYVDVGEPAQADVDQDLHSGRIRSFAHERGNWSTYVYVPYLVSRDLKEELDQFLTTLPFSHLRPCDDLHISLSKTIVMRYHWIEPFTESLRRQMQSMKSFCISAVLLDVYTNEEKTRTFLGIKVDGKELLQLVSMVNESLSKFNLSSFYEEPSFHLSIGWCVGDKWSEIKEVLPNMQELFDGTFDEDLLSVVAKSIACKSGNKIHNFPFGDQ